MFHTIFYQPLYNLLVWLAGISGGNLGLSVIILTLVVKVILSPLAHRASHSQRANQSKMAEIQEKIKEIQKKHKDSKEAQGRATLELYKAHGFNPLTSFLLVLIQLPVLFAIYQVVRVGLPFNSSELYSFVAAPLLVSPVFLGINLLEKSVLLAILVAVTQFIQMKLAIPPTAKNSSKPDSMQAHFAQSMQFNMRYVMPLVIGFISLSFPAALSLYWTVNNLFTIGHEMIVKRQVDQLKAGEQN